MCVCFAQNDDRLKYFSRATPLASVSRESVNIQANTLESIERGKVAARNTDWSSLEINERITGRWDDNRVIIARTK